MPIYEFRCVKCRHVTEVMRSVKRRDRPAPYCGECGGKTEKATSVPAPALFKGKRWAKDGYSGGKAK